MPVPQENLSFVEQASCLFLTIVGIIPGYTIFQCNYLYLVFLYSSSMTRVV
ncbi:hypothetical protein QUB12_18155 [Microcoleus sp. B7-D4]